MLAGESCSRDGTSTADHECPHVTVSQYTEYCNVTSLAWYQHCPATVVHSLRLQAGKLFDVHGLLTKGHAAVQGAADQWSSEFAAQNGENDWANQFAEQFAD